MSFALRFAVLILAAFASANFVASVATLWQWRRARMPLAPQDRATFCFRLRLLPLVAALLSTALATSSFFLFEPRAQDERVGVVLVGLGAIGLVLIVAAAARIAYVTRGHRRLLRAWLREASPITLPGAIIPALAIDSEFPVVAVVGVWRPRLIVARRVIAGCAPDELAAILDHEHGHVIHWDNARRSLLLALPDLLSWTRIGRAIDLAWHDAAEEVADEAPGDNRGDAGRVALAAALVRVATMVPAGGTLVEFPANALYRGEPLERRVRRLLDPIPPRPRAPRICQWAALAVFVGVCVVLLNPVHEFLEAAVSLLP